MKWFRHDSNAHNDARLQKILMRYGAQGYALYWYCLELIAGKVDAQNITFELEHDAEILGYALKIDTLQVEKIMLDMVDTGLFENSSGTITCLKMLKRLDDHTARNPEIKSVIAQHSEDSTKSVQRDSEDSTDKHEEAPDKHGADYIRLDNKNNNAHLNSLEMFNRFWDCYPRKEGKKRAEKIFIKNITTENLLNTILENVKSRIKSEEWSGKNKKFIPHASTYLNGERWKDELSLQVSANGGDQFCH